MERIVGLVVPLLPEHKPRMMHGLGTPAEVLACVALGVDLFETAYPAVVTSHGAAMVVSVRQHWPSVPYCLERFPRFFVLALDGSRP